jgi:hypothetical protein
VQWARLENLEPFSGHTHRKGERKRKILVAAPPAGPRRAPGGPPEGQRERERERERERHLAGPLLGHQQTARGRKGPETAKPNRPTAKTYSWGSQGLGHPPAAHFLELRRRTGVSLAPLHFAHSAEKSAVFRQPCSHQGRLSSAAEGRSGQFGS